MTVWLILWRYYDGSDAGVIDRAFSKEDDARWFAQTLIDQGSGRTYALVTVDITGDDA